MEPVPAPDLPKQSEPKAEPEKEVVPPGHGPGFHMVEYRDKDGNPTGSFFKVIDGFRS